MSFKFIIFLRMKYISCIFFFSVGVKCCASWLSGAKIAFSESELFIEMNTCMRESIKPWSGKQLRPLFLLVTPTLPCSDAPCFRTYTQRNHSLNLAEFNQIWMVFTLFPMILHQINRNSVNAIQIWFDLAIFFIPPGENITDHGSPIKDFPWNPSEHNSTICYRGVEGEHHSSIWYRGVWGGPKSYMPRETPISR